MRQEVRWTNLNYEQIADHLAEEGTPVSVPVVKQLLDLHDYGTRKAQKSQAMGGHADRNQQFENIARLKREYLASDDPIVSMDTKKKELIGNFYRKRPVKAIVDVWATSAPGTRSVSRRPGSFAPRSG